MADEALRKYRADLHIHTVLSPCAGVEMIPPLIVRQALAKEIDIIAVTDHNSSANVRAVREAAAGTSLTVMPGMELQTREEVHLLCLFDTLEQLDDWQAIVDESMPQLENDASVFGEQFVVDKDGGYIRSEDRLLLASAGLSLDSAVVLVDQIGGLAIPAHVDRPAFSLIPNLGFLPQHLPIYAVEISRHTDASNIGQAHPWLAGYCLIKNGDVHQLDEFMGATEYRIAQPTVAELQLALQQQENRSARIVAAQN